MAIKGGYKIIDFKNNVFTDGGSAITIAGIYNAIKKTKKSTMVSGLVVGDTAYADAFVTFVTTDDGLEGDYAVQLDDDTAVEALHITITAADAVTVESVDVSAGGGGQYTLPAATADTLGGVKVGNGLSVTEDGTISAAQYTLPAATASALGGVKVGSGLSVTEDGTISATGGGGSSEITLVDATGFLLQNNYDGTTAPKAGLFDALRAAYTAGKPIFLTGAKLTSEDASSTPIPIYMTSTDASLVRFIYFTYTGFGTPVVVISVASDDKVAKIVSE